MYRFFYYLRILFTIVFVFAIIGAVYYFMNTRTTEEQTLLYNRQATAAVETAVANALYAATRTIEAPLPHYRLIQVEAGESLEEVAKRFETSLEIVQMANNLPASVLTGDGGRVIVPQGVRALDPPRYFRLYSAIDGDTLAALAEQNELSLDLLQQDNPVLAQRGLIPGDIVFVAVLF